MVYDYVVTLKRENARRTDLVSFILLILSVLAFIYVQARVHLNLFFCFSIFIILTGLIMNMISLQKGNELHFRSWLFVAGILWIGMPFLQWLAIPFFLLGFLEVQAKYPLEIGFDSDGAVLNSLFKKKFPWSAFQSVILKDGLLTLDFKNNKLIQKEVLEDDEPDAPEDEFNDYCRRKIVISP